MDSEKFYNKPKQFNQSKLNREKRRLQLQYINKTKHQIEVPKIIKSWRPILDQYYQNPESCQASKIYFALDNKSPLPFSLPLNIPLQAVGSVYHFPSRQSLDSVITSLKTKGKDILEVNESEKEQSFKRKLPFLINVPTSKTTKNIPSKQKQGIDKGSLLSKDKNSEEIVFLSSIVSPNIIVKEIIKEIIKKVVHESENGISSSKSP